MNRQGKLLVAHPNLSPADPFFQTVIYVYSDTPQSGTLGMVLNYNSNVTVKTICAAKGVDYYSEQHYVRHGGPLGLNSISIIHSDDWESGSSRNIGNRLYLTSDDPMLERLSIEEPAYWRMFAGYCGWAPGQLDMELKGVFPYRPEHSWLVIDSSDELVFEHDDEKQWQLAIERSSQQMIDKFFL